MQVNKETFLRELGVKISMKLSPFHLLRMFANWVSNIAKNTSRNCENTAQDIAKMECLNTVKWLNQDREYFLEKTDFFQIIPVILQLYELD